MRGPFDLGVRIKKRDAQTLRQSPAHCGFT